MQKDKLFDADLLYMFEFQTHFFLQNLSYGINLLCFLCIVNALDVWIEI